MIEGRESRPQTLTARRLAVLDESYSSFLSDLLDPMGESSDLGEMLSE